MPREDVWKRRERGREGKHQWRSGRMVISGAHQTLLESNLFSNLLTSKYQLFRIQYQRQSELSFRLRWVSSTSLPVTTFFLEVLRHLLLLKKISMMGVAYQVLNWLKESLPGMAGVWQINIIGTDVKGINTSLPTYFFSGNIASYSHWQRKRIGWM